MRQRYPVWLSFGLGLALSLCFAPFGAWWLSPILLALHVECWRTRDAWRAGFAFGAGAFLTGTYWLYHAIYVIGKVPLPLAAVLMLGLVGIMALYYGAFAYFARRFAGDSLWRLALLMPALWVIVEWLRGWVLSGFPWLTLGYSLPDTPLSGWLALGGVYLGSFVLMALAVCLLLLWRGSRRERLVGGVSLIVVLLVSLLIARIEWVKTDPQKLSVAIGQAGIEQSLKWDPDQFQATLSWYAQFVADHAGTQVLLMPEVAVPTLAGRVEPYLAQLQSMRGKSDVLLGILRSDEDGNIFNSLLALGDERAFYDKRHLVPFGEYFPVPAFVREWMRLRGLPHGDLLAGEAAQTPLVVAGVSVATSICYEDAYGAEQSIFFPAARLIINVSNDAWFGDTIAPHQHLQIARTRSAESRRWQLRATNTGISAIIDANGRVVERSPAFVPAVLSGEVALAAGHTPYTRLGNWPVLLLSLGMIGVVAASRR